MAITTTCPGCKAIFRLPDELAGKSVRCQKCAWMFVVPLFVTGQGMPMPSEVEAEASIPEIEPSAPLPDQPAALIALAEPDLEPILVEPSEVKPEASSAPIPEKPRPAPVVASRSPRRLWTAATIGLFVLALGATGAFAALWVSTHLSPPPRVVLVPPLKETPRNPFEFKDRFEIKDRKDFLDGGKDRFPEKRHSPFLAPFDGEGRYEATHQMTNGDALEPSAPGRGPYKEYIVTMAKGQNYRVDVKSTRFAPMVSLFDEQTNQLSHSAGAVTATIDFTPNQTGTYRIRAIATQPFDRGEYTIKIAESP